MYRNKYTEKVVVLLVIALMCVAFAACNSTATSGNPENSKDVVTGSQGNNLDFTVDNSKAYDDPSNISGSGIFEADDLNNEAVGTTHESPAVGLDPTGIYNTNEKIEMEGLVFSDFCILSMDEKLMPGIPKNVIFYMYENTDENGTLQDGKVYIFAKMSIENTSSKSREYYFPTSGFIVADENLFEIARAEEPRYISSNSKAGERSKDLYRIELAAGEKKEITFAYIMDKVSVESGTLYFGITNGFVSDEMKYIPFTGFKAT